MFLDILPRASQSWRRHFLAGVKNIFRVKNLLNLRENFNHLFTIHFFQVRRADDAIIMLCGNRSVICEYEVLHFFSKLQYNFRRIST